MNPTASASASARLELLESRVGLRVAACMSEAAESLPAGVEERLRFAREQALERAKARRAAEAPAVVGQRGGVAVLGGGPSRWFKLAAVLPLVALVAGLLLIGEWHGRQQVEAAAEIDALLLSDDLPPGAYADPGFVEFLKKPRE
jgi:hypothetical protein